MNNNTIHDAPSDWEHYSRLLKTLPLRTAKPEQTDALRVSVLQRTLSARPRTSLIAGVGGLALAAVVLTLFGIGHADRLAPEHLAPPISVVKEIPARHRSVPRTMLRRLPSPATLPTGVDTTIPRNPSSYSGHHPAIPPMPPAAPGR